MSLPLPPLVLTAIDAVITQTAEDDVAAFAAKDRIDEQSLDEKFAVGHTEPLVIACQQVDSVRGVTADELIIAFCWADGWNSLKIDDHSFVDFNKFNSKVCHIRSPKLAAQPHWCQFARINRSIKFNARLSPRRRLFRHRYRPQRSIRSCRYVILFRSLINTLLFFLWPWVGILKSDCVFRTKLLPR